MSTAPQLAPVKALSREEFENAALKIVLEDGLSPAKAVAEVFQTRDAADDALLEWAHVGCTDAVQRLIKTHSREAAGSRSRGRVRQLGYASGEELREQISGLRRVFQGADGTVKPLERFDIKDLVFVETRDRAIASGAMLRLKFAKRGRMLLAEHKAETLGVLPTDARAEVSKLADEAWG